MVLPMTKTPQDDQYSDEETAARMEQALRRALNTPHKPHKDRPTVLGVKKGSREKAPKS